MSNAISRLKHLEDLAAAGMCSPEQEEELRRLQIVLQTVQHDPTVPKHPTDFDRHPTKPRKEGDESKSVS